MKNILIFLIKIYQRIPFPSHGQCRFTPTCSEYAKEAIERFGSIKGTSLAIKRILKCRPLGPFGYDPVPQKEK